MKLLFCKDCTHIFNLSKRKRSCTCGKTSGRYVDSINAEYSGPGIPLGIANPSFARAIRKQPAPYRQGEEFTAFVIAPECSTVKKVS